MDIFHRCISIGKTAMKKNAIEEMIKELGWPRSMLVRFPWSSSVAVIIRRMMQLLGLEMPEIAPGKPSTLMKSPYHSISPGLLPGNLHYFSLVLSSG